MQIRFLVSSIKYPPIPVEQNEDDKPFAPMQINVRVGSCICIVIRMHSFDMFIFIIVLV
jgi:hypothetical protein